MDLDLSICCSYGVAALLLHIAAINAATLALLDAGVALRDMPVACTVSYVQKTALLGE